MGVVWSCSIASLHLLRLEETFLGCLLGGDDFFQGRVCLESLFVVMLLGGVAPLGVV